MARPATMSDIADQAGVSRVAVSYALNGRPGVSDELRARIKQIAEDLGFTANLAAQAVHGAAAHAIGLAMRRPATELSAEVFRRQLISGIQVELAAHGYGLALQFAGTLALEVEIYRRWVAERRVDGVIICDEELNDPRLPALAEFGIPAVILGPPPAEPSRFTYVWSDEENAAARLIRYLSEQGHRHFARVTGPSGMLHTQRRTEALTADGDAAGLVQTIRASDYTGEGGARAVRSLLSSSTRPTAIVLDNDLMAVAALGVAQDMGVSVPGELSIIAWEDSAPCELVRPAITALRRNISDHGTKSAALLLRHIETKQPATLRIPGAELVIRGSSGPAPR